MFIFIWKKPLLQLINHRLISANRIFGVTFTEIDRTWPFLIIIWGKSKSLILNIKQNNLLDWNDLRRKWGAKTA